jgi:hypothetical protein
MRRRLSYANVMATLAFFFALTGGAMAGAKFLQASDPITQGDLAGSTYGNPVIAAGKVTTGKIGDGAITSSKFDSSAVAPSAAKLGPLQVVTATQAFVLLPGAGTGLTDEGTQQSLACTSGDGIAVKLSVTDKGPDLVVAHQWNRSSVGLTFWNYSHATSESVTVNLVCLE